MRLTLRTLLAYVDSALPNPTDLEELGKKIESSDFATELIHRTRDTVRRLRLGAPAVLAEDSEDVLGGDVSVDANTVAEYIDGELVPEQVADYERICLEQGTEADIHLAEVASSHHILAMVVVNEPANIDREMRQKMYDLPQELERRTSLRIEPAHRPVAETPAPAPQERTPIAPVSPSSEAEEMNHEVPDYLRVSVQRRHRRIQMIAAAVILVMIGGIGYLLWPTGDPEVSREVAEATEDLDELVVEIDSPSESGSTSDSVGGEAPPFEPSVPSEDTAESADEGTEGTLAAKPPVETTEPETQSVGAATETDLTSDANTAVNSPVATSGVEGETISTENFSADEGVIQSEDDGDLAPLPPDRVASDSDATDDPNQTEVSEESIAESVGVPPPPEPVGPVLVGNFRGSSSDILVRRDFVSGNWVRLAPRTSIFAGDLVLAFPHYRPHIALAEADLYVTGGTHLAFVEDATSPNDSTAGVEVQFGRILVNAGLNGGQVKLVIGGEERLIELGGSAGLAVEVRPVFIPGSDFEREQSPIEVNWYLTSGSVEWPGQAGGTRTIEAPSTWQTLDGIDELPEQIEELPAWIDREQLTGTERRARDTLVEQLATGETVGLTLQELTDPKLRWGQRKEVRTLASSCMLHLGYFKPFVQSLNDVDQIRAWPAHIDSLRTALSFSPEVAARVRKAMEDMRGPEAAVDLMEMVQGYSREQIGRTPAEQQDGVLVKLLGWLDSDSLDYRVLAIYNLNQIAGVSPGVNLADYQPSADIRQRERSLRRLWKRFEDNELLLNRGLR